MAKHVLAILLLLDLVGALACNCPPPHPGHPPKHRPPHDKPSHPPKHKPPTVKPPHPPVRPPTPYYPPPPPPPVPCPPPSTTPTPPTPVPRPPPTPPVVPHPPPPAPPAVPYPPPPSPAPAGRRCPIDALKLGACVDLLSGLVHVIIGRELVKEKCCPVIEGLVGLDAALCLCTTIRAKLLNINIILPIALEALVGCGKSVPPGFRCPAPSPAGPSN